MNKTARRMKEARIATVANKRAQETDRTKADRKTIQRNDVIELIRFNK